MQTRERVRRRMCEMTLVLLIGYCSTSRAISLDTDGTTSWNSRAPLPS